MNLITSFANLLLESYVSLAEFFGDTLFYQLHCHREVLSLISLIVVILFLILPIYVAVKVIDVIHLFLPWLDTIEAAVIVEEHLIYFT